MEKKPENPFVYPQEETKTVGEVQHRRVVCHGMTLRDWLAGEIAAQLTPNNWDESPEEIAKLSYVQADAMLVERGKK